MVCGLCIIGERNLCEWAEEVECKNSSRCYKLTMRNREIFTVIAEIGRNGFDVWTGSVASFQDEEVLVT